MLDAENLKTVAWVAMMITFAYKGPGLIKYASNGPKAAPQDREIRTSSVVDQAVAAKLARKPRQEIRSEAVRSDALVDEEMSVGTIES